MADEEPKRKLTPVQEAWARSAAELAAAYIPRTAEAVGTRCATDFCDVTTGISYEKPLRRRIG